MLEEMSAERKLLVSINNKFAPKSSASSTNSRVNSANTNYNNNDFGNHAGTTSQKFERSNNSVRQAKDSFSRTNYKSNASSRRHSNNRASGNVSSSEVVDTGNEANDLGSVFRPGSKKAGDSLKDLLNFDYGTRGARRRNALWFSRNENYEERGGHRFAPRRLSTSFYNKDQFLLANCQFVVSDKFDYGVHLADPDVLVDWDKIEEVRLLEQEIQSCPICLHPSVAGQITRCGHVFCYPCILHYLSLSDKPWRKCPICYESVYKNQLRSVLSSKVISYVEGQEITFRLMFRQKGSNVITPASSELLSASVRNSKDEFARFSKLLLVSNCETLRSTIEREKMELNNQYDAEHDEPESCFIVEALNYVDRRTKLLVPSDVTKSSEIGHKTSTPLLHDIGDIKKFTDAFNDVRIKDKELVYKTQKSYCAAETGLKDNCLPGTSLKGSQGGHEDKLYYFYQSDDGQPLFMHPLNVHCLIREYGSLERAPNIIHGSVVEVDTFTMCAETRKRYRYLGHLPLTSSFGLIEFQFREDDQVVSKKTLSFFVDEFEKRRRFRIKKQNDERRQQQRCQLWEKAMMHNTSKYSLGSIRSIDEFPVSRVVQSAQSEIEATVTDRDYSLASPDHFAPSLSSSDHGSVVDEPHGLSFAQMLKCGKPKPAVQPTPKSATQCSSNADEPAEYAPVALTTYRSEIGDALKLALDNFHSKEGSSDQNDVEGEQQHQSVQSCSNKKRKKKGKILFTLLS